MTDRVKQLQDAADRAVAGMGVPTCKTCVHFKKSSWINECAATGLYAKAARNFQNECGHHARYWTPRPPTFWQRLGNAIIRRVKG